YRGGPRHAGAAAPAAARLPRRAGRPMRLLPLRHPDFRRRTARPQSRSQRGPGARGTGPQPVPLRRAQPHRAGRIAGGQGDQQAMTAAAELPVNLKANPRLSRWLRFNRDGYVELSQGIVTALAQIAADELDVRLERIRMVPVSTAASPNEGTTSSSLSVEQSGSAVRHAAAQARAIYLA